VRLDDNLQTRATEFSPNQTCWSAAQTESADKPDWDRGVNFVLADERTAFDIYNGRVAG
jgi:hypothetical protein